MLGDCVVGNVGQVLAQAASKLSFRRLVKCLADVVQDVTRGGQDNILHLRRRCAIKIVRNDPRELVLNLGLGISVRCL